MVNERVALAEEALGKRIPKGAQIFEYDGHIVICQDKAYNRLLHRRVKSKSETGEVDKRKCAFCGKWDREENLYLPIKGTAYHRDCYQNYVKEFYKQAYRVSPLVCQRGHWIDGWRGAQRYCKTCQKESERRFRAKKKEENRDRD